MSTTTPYLTRVRQAQETVKGASEARVRDAKAVFKLVPTRRNGLLKPGEALDQTARLTKRLTQVNVDYVRDLAGVTRRHVSGLAGVVKDEVLTTAKLANKQADKLEEVVLEQADEVQRAERAAARRAKKAAHDASAEQYQDMTKVELSEELASRDLPKTGNVDELRDRLIASDLA
jgi:hypothetical protein